MSFLDQASIGGNPFHDKHNSTLREPNKGAQSGFQNKNKSNSAVRVTKEKLRVATVYLKLPRCHGQTGTRRSAKGLCDCVSAAENTLKLFQVSGTKGRK